MKTASAAIRPARPGESEALSRLTLRSKAHWGYDDAFLDACRDELLVTEDAIASGSVAVLETDRRSAGIYALAFVGEIAELELFFVEPRDMGRGYGRRLWDHAVEAARDAGATRLLIQSDPNAEGFYLRMGAERTGSSPSASIPGRSLPVLEVRL